jgi:hypothetical protein
MIYFSYSDASNRSTSIILVRLALLNLPERRIPLRRPAWSHRESRLPLYWELIPSIALIVLMAVGFAFVFMHLRSLNDSAVTAVFLAVAAFFASERIVAVFALVGKYKSDIEDKANLAAIHEDILASCDTIVHAMANTRGVTRLGQMSNALNHITKLFGEAVVIRDITFRTDGNVDIDQYEHGIERWVLSVWSNISTIESYDLILCNQTKSYPEIFLTDEVDSVDKLPKKFHIRIMNEDFKIPFPNFLILYDKDWSKSMVLGWPFSSGTTGPLFLVEEQGLISYFERLYSALWEQSRPISAKPSA